MTICNIYRTQEVIMRKIRAKERDREHDMCQGEGTFMQERHEVHTKPTLLSLWNKSLSYWHEGVKHIALGIHVKHFCILEKEIKKSPLPMRKGRKILRSHVIRDYPLGKG